MQALDRSLTVAEIVTAHPTCARVFRDHRIDFCCRGGVSVAEACRAVGVDPATVYAALEDTLAQGRGGEDRDFARLPTPALIAYVVNKHHGYLRRAIPWIAQMSARVARVHGEHNPKLPELHAAYGELVGLLEAHLDLEEQVLFPTLMSSGAARSIIDRELRAMHGEHLAVGDLLARLRALADDYTVPSWGCGTYRALFGELEELEGDVLRHIHLENHVLMPRFQTTGGAHAAGPC